MKTSCCGHLVNLLLHLIIQRLFDQYAICTLNGVSCSIAFLHGVEFFVHLHFCIVPKWHSQPQNHLLGGQSATKIEEELEDEDVVLWSFGEFSLHCICTLH